MNKFVTLVVVALLVALPVQSCWYPSYEPDEFLVYRPIKEYWNIYGHQLVSTPTWSDIIDSLATQAANTPEERRVLAFAQQVQEERMTLVDPWHYCYQGDTLVATLDSLSQVAISRLSTGQGDRYMIQAVRILASLHRYQEIIELWKDYRWNDKKLSMLVRGHLAGAYYHRGQFNEALTEYQRCCDMAGIKLCMRKMGGEQLSYKELFQGLKYCDSNVVYDYITSILFREVYKGYSSYATDCLKNKDSLILQCQEMVQYCPQNCVPLLRYTEAYLLYEKGKMPEALHAIHLAQKGKSRSLLKNSIRVLQMLIEAETRPYNQDYLVWLDHQTRWLMKLSQGNSGVTNRWDETPVRKDFINWNFCRNTHCSSEYYTDMLHRMVDCSVVPKMLAAGDTIHAIQMLDVVDYCGMKDEDKVELNDHGCSSFCFAYECDSRTLQKLLNSYTDRIGHLWAEFGSGRHTDKWIDLVGTRLLLDGCYEAAEKYLSLVSDSFLQVECGRPIDWNSDDCWNSSKSLKYKAMRDPFALEYFSGGRPNHKSVYTPLVPDYKLCFARRMVQLQRQMHSSDPDVSGKASILLATGMHNSVTVCWWLTGYGWGVSPFFDYMNPNDAQEQAKESLSTTINTFLAGGYMWDWGEGLPLSNTQHRIHKLLAQSRQYQERGVQMMLDHEQLAMMLWRMGHYRTVKYRLGDTDFAHAKQGACDRWDFW